MEIIYARERPQIIRNSMMLLGPSPRGETDPKWDWRRSEAIPLLNEMGFSGQVVIPLPETGPFIEDEDNPDAQPEWELDLMFKVTAKIMWLCRDDTFLPGRTSNTEFGLCTPLNGFFYGRPDGAPHTRYHDYLARRYHLPPVENTLRATLTAGLRYLDEFVR